MITGVFKIKSIQGRRQLEKTKANKLQEIEFHTSLWL